jgi:lipopolysaccharide export system protein LptA
LWLVALLGPASALPQTDTLRLPVVIDADQTHYDGKSSMLQFKGLRLTQGSLGIQADLAHASRMDFDDSVWRFSGNVVFDLDGGHVECDSADLEFSDFELRVATIEGSPASFEFLREGNTELTYASADKLHYDVAKGVIQFSGNATVTEGGSQIASESLVYNVTEQRVAASGNGSDRVKVIFKPPAATTDETSGTAPDQDEAADEDTGQ